MEPGSDHHIGHPEHQRRLAQIVMRRQLVLSVRIAAVFMAILLGLPLVNYFLPRLANFPIGGFTLTWFFLAVLFYPLTWFLSWVFIRQSNDIESDIARSMQHQVQQSRPVGDAAVATSQTSGYVPAASDEPLSGSGNGEKL